MCQSAGLPVGGDSGEAAWSRCGAPHVLRRRSGGPSRWLDFFSRGDRLGTDARSLGPQRVTGARTPQPQTRLGPRPPKSPRSPDCRLTAAGGSLPGRAGAPRRHGAAEHPALRERAAGSAVLGPAAHRPRTPRSRHRPPPVSANPDRESITSTSGSGTMEYAYICTRFVAGVNISPSAQLWPEGEGLPP